MSDGNRPPPKQGSEEHHARARLRPEPFINHFASRQITPELKLASQNPRTNFAQAARSYLCMVSSCWNLANNKIIGMRELKALHWRRPTHLLHNNCWMRLSSHGLVLAAPTHDGL